MLLPAAGKVYRAVAKQGRRHGERRSAHHEHVGGDHAMEGNAQAGGPLDTVLAVVDDHVPSGHIRMLEKRTQVLRPPVCLQAEEWRRASVAAKFGAHGAHSEFRAEWVRWGWIQP